ncbi:PfkB family carbohydrate kinase [Microbacterium sp.]|uniref:PfkB family carbohydrate kinase n=1 Tax=Microbacterium sp. TaxID=51671 RepID=UPI0028116190|nr:PfkB family carbohydrate kinase [Microbacterium sp.]
MDIEQSGAVVIGDALIDEIRDAGGVRELVGGAALNVAVGLRRLGVPATLIAMVGQDAAGDHIREYLHDHGVRLIESRAKHGSSRAVVQRNWSGEPEYFFNKAARKRSIRFGEEAREAISAAEIVVVSCFPFDVETEADALAEAVEGSRLVIDPNPRSGMMRDRGMFVRSFERLAVRAELVKVGSDDATLLYDGDLDALRRRLRELGTEAVLATAGSLGAILDTDAGVFTAPIAELPGPIVDTVGAGDATLAAAVAGLMTAPPTTPDAWQELLERAMAVAAATCRSEGGLLRTPESLVDAERGVFGS